MSDELKKAKESFVKKIFENKSEAILAKKYYNKIENLLKEKKVITIKEVSEKLNISFIDAKTIFEELILYNVVSGKIERDSLVLY
ncbi:MAG: hypothetical protein ACTSRG_17215 [Candidatus Helarchaeota archaeon]